MAPHDPVRGGKPRRMGEGFKERSDSKDGAKNWRLNLQKEKTLAAGGEQKRLAFNLEGIYSIRGGVIEKAGVEKKKEGRLGQPSRNGKPQRAK